MHRAVARLLSCLLLGLLTGCTSYQSEGVAGPGLAGLQRVFVISNANDSRGLEHRIVASLKARGFTAESGPRTMLPDDTQAVLTYRDHWTWDFGERLVHLEISVLRPADTQPVAGATYGAKIPGRQSLPEIVDQLVGRLAGGKAR